MNTRWPFLVIGMLITLFAIQKGLQFFAVVSFVTSIGIYYKHIANKFIDVALDASRRASSAKVGNLQLEIGDNRIDLSRLHGNAPEWARAVLLLLTMDFDYLHSPPKPYHIAVLV